MSRVGQLIIRAEALAREYDELNSGVGYRGEETWDLLERMASFIEAVLPLLLEVENRNETRRKHES